MPRKKSKNRTGSRGDSAAPSRPHSKKDLERLRKFAVAYQAVGQTTYLNATQSALLAGYSESSAKVASRFLLTKPVVQEMMREIRDSRLASSTIATPAEVLEILTRQARATPDMLVDSEGKFLPLNKLSKDILYGIAGVKSNSKTTTNKAGDTVTTTTLEYKLSDRTRASELLAKHHGLFEKDNEQQKQDPAKLTFVMMPSGNMSITDWCQQAEIVLSKQAEQKTLPAPPSATPRAPVIDKNDPNVIDITPKSDSLDFLNIDDLED